MLILSKPKWPRRRILKGRSSRTPPTSYLRRACSSGMRVPPASAASVGFFQFCKFADQTAHRYLRRVGADIDGCRVGHRGIDALLRLKDDDVLIEDDARIPRETLRQLGVIDAKIANLRIKEER